jgi:hypothetical protein
VRLKTVHEVDSNGDTLCGNGARDGYASYTTLPASAVAGQKACLNWAWNARRPGVGPRVAQHRVSERQLQRLVSRGKVRSSTIGRRRLLHREDLDKAATGEEVAPTTPPRRRGE